MQKKNLKHFLWKMFNQKELKMHIEEIKRETTINFVDGSDQKIFPTLIGSEYKGMLFVHHDNNRIVVKKYKEKSFPHGTGREPEYESAVIISVINFNNVTSIEY